MPNGGRKNSVAYAHRQFRSFNTDYCDIISWSFGNKNPTLWNWEKGNDVTQNPLRLSSPRLGERKAWNKLSKQNAQLWRKLPTNSGTNDFLCMRCHRYNKNQAVVNGKRSKLDITHWINDVCVLKIREKMHTINLISKWKTLSAEGYIKLINLQCGPNRCPFLYR